MADDKSKQDAKAEEEARLAEMKKIAERMLTADKPQAEPPGPAQQKAAPTGTSYPLPLRPAAPPSAEVPQRPAPTPAQQKPAPPAAAAPSWAAPMPVQPKLATPSRLQQKPAAMHEPEEEEIRPMRPEQRSPFIPPERPQQKEQRVEYAEPRPARPRARGGPPGLPSENIVRGVAQRITASSPNLRQKLRLAGMNDDPLLFVQQSLVIAGMMSVMLTVLFFFLLQIFKFNVFTLVVLFPLFFAFSFMMRMQMPKAKAQKRAREVERELVFAGRQMLIELKAGVPLFDAMLSISRDYGEISNEFAKIVDRVNAGVPTDVAMHDVAEDNPSMAFKRVILQLINSIRSGSDVAKALAAVLDQVSREQITDLKAYGQKLNPLGMFYMVFGIIMPSLGIALAIIIFSFLSINIDATILYAFLFVIAMLQYIFVTVIESQKPQYEF